MACLLGYVLLTGCLDVVTRMLIFEIVYIPQQLLLTFFTKRLSLGIQYRSRTLAMVSATLPGKVARWVWWTSFFVYWWPSRGYIGYSPWMRPLDSKIFSSFGCKFRRSRSSLKCWLAWASRWAVFIHHIFWFSTSTEFKGPESRFLYWLSTIVKKPSNPCTNSKNFAQLMLVQQLVEHVVFGNGDRQHLSRGLGFCIPRGTGFKGYIRWPLIAIWQPLRSESPGLVVDHTPTTASQICRIFSSWYMVPRYVCILLNLVYSV